MYWDNIYIKIAETIDLAIKEPPYSYIHLKELLKNIVDIESDDHGFLISINFLYDIYHLYNEEYKRDNYSPFVYSFVKKVNTFTISYYGELNDFINSLEWDSNGVPTNWARISNEIGFNINR